MKAALRAFALLLAGLALGVSRRPASAQEPAPGALTSKVVAMAAAWEAKRVPPSSRVVNLVLSDASSGPDPFVPSKDAAPGKASAWLKRTLRSKGPASAAATAFSKAFADDPDTVVWTHEGFASAPEDQMMRDISQAIVKANDAGAEVNVVTQGVGAVPALKAVKSLEGVVSKGAKVGVNKFVAVGVDMPLLKKLDPGFFGSFRRPSNLLELAAIWTTDMIPRTTIIELYSERYAGTQLTAEDAVSKIFPKKSQEGSWSASADLVRELLRRVEPLEKTFAPFLQAAASARPGAPQAGSSPAPLAAPLGPGPLANPLSSEPEASAPTPGTPLDDDAPQVLRPVPRRQDSLGFVQSDELKSMPSPRTPPPPGSGLRCVGVTKAQFNGNLGGELEGARRKCAADFRGSRMCPRSVVTDDPDCPMDAWGWAEGEEECAAGEDEWRTSSASKTGSVTGPGYNWEKVGCDKTYPIWCCFEF
ncbi:MAG: hypothetical protein HY927_09640 [Elusimicrobia bacterium]|nr:hypothetical protein [Elusimicrobiota bacterium]